MDIKRQNNHINDFYYKKKSEKIEYLKPNRIGFEQNVPARLLNIMLIGIVFTNPSRTTINYYRNSAT